jgi:hypothetical protein
MQGSASSTLVTLKEIGRGLLLRETRTAEGGAVSRASGFYRMWTIRMLAVMLVVFCGFLGACGQQGQPKENQPAQGNTAGQPQEEGGRPVSEIAPLGPGTYILYELPSPGPVSAGYGLQDVSVRSDGHMYAHPPSGATFTIKNERRPVSVAFTPSFISDVPAKKTDGVTFEVLSGEERLYQKHVLPDDSASEVTLDLPEAATKNVVQLSFVTTPGPSGNRNWDWALWRDVRIVVGKGE